MRSFSRLAKKLFAAGLLAMPLLQGAAGHTYLSSVILNNEALAEGDCVRPHPSTAFDFPIPLVTSREMKCGWEPYASQAANRACPIQAGASIGIQWHHNHAGPTDDIMERTHVGPVSFYLAKADSNGEGDVWFKIYEDGLDMSQPEGKRWATERLIDNRGVVTVTIPSDIQSGKYLLRGDIVALHNGYMLDGAQPYVGCVELNIQGGGSANPAGVSFPGYYKNTDPGFNVNVYQPVTSYIIPGPALYKSGSSTSTPKPTSAATSAPTSTPAATSAPTAAATPKPASTDAPVTAPRPSTGSSNSAAGIKIAMNSGSNTWWLGVVLSGVTESLRSVSIKDSGAFNSWSVLAEKPYAFVFSQENYQGQLTLPVSVRIVTSSGKESIYQDVFTAWGQTGEFAASSGSASATTPTQAATAAPTQAATSAPTQSATSAPTKAATSAPTQSATVRPVDGSNNNNAGSSSIGITVYSTANDWWFALSSEGLPADIASVEVKDSGSISSYAFMTYAPWGYSLPAHGQAFVAPLTVRIKNEAGKSFEATVSAITPNARFAASQKN